MEKVVPLQNKPLLFNFKKKSEYMGKTMLAHHFFKNSLKLIDPLKEPLKFGDLKKMNKHEQQDIVDKVF